jgi:Uma2 family endonuclease
MTTADARSLISKDTISPKPSLLKQAIEVKIGKGDVRTIQRGKTWKQFEHLQQGFDRTRGVKLFYYDGTIEILMPGIAHELFKKIIAILIEAYLLDRKIEFEPNGSMTHKQEGKAVAEADESYEIQGAKLCIEVNFTSGGESKLTCYQALGVDEVWFWEDGVLAVYSLQADGYRQVNHSQIPALTKIDLKIMAGCILAGETSRIKAVEKFRAAHAIN